MTAPIALFVYNRPTHTRQTVEALRDNALAGASDLFIFSDAPKSEVGYTGVAEVRRYLRQIEGFKSVTIIEREKNWGVDPSIIDGVTMLCGRFGQVIVLEDDLVTSPWFLTYMNRSLGLYRDEERVMQVSGFMFPIAGFRDTEATFLKYATCWGWATWDRAWSQFRPNADGYQLLANDATQRRAFDINGSYDYFGLLQAFMTGKVDAWDIRWYLTVFVLDGLALFPHKSLVSNIGLDGSGVHGDRSGATETSIAQHEIVDFPKVEADPKLWKAIETYLMDIKKKNAPSTVQRVARRLSRYSLARGQTPL
jgi:hypothetical protein